MYTNFWERIDGWHHRPFPRLVRHAIHRIFSGGESAEPGELDLSIGTILAVLAAPGAIASLILSDRYGSLLRFVRGQQIGFNPYTASVSDEYFFIALAVVVPAAIAVWKWDRLLPDRRDFLNLAPLPIPGRANFFANVSAILCLAALLSIDVNVVSCVLFPVFVTAQDSFGIFLKFFATHVLAVLSASAFGFLSVFALLGAMMAILPYRVFRKTSFYVRCGLLFCLLALLTTALTVPRKFPALAHVARPWARVPPPAWFLGLCESMRGLRRPAFASFDSAALWALALVLLLSVAAFSVSYRRCYLRSAEMVESRPAGGSPGSFVFRWLDRVLLKNSFERACYRFALRALFRSQEHAFIFGAFATIGVILASQDLLPALAAQKPAAGAIPSPEILSIPLVLGFFTILGMYAAFSIPATLRCNWIFRFNVDPKNHHASSLARKVAFTFLVPLLFAPCLAAYSYFWGWRVGILHTALVATWCALLLEGLLVKFRKIPFTCSVAGFTDHAIVAALLSLLGFFAFTSVTTTAENWALTGRIFLVAFLPVAAGFFFLFRYQRKGLIESDRCLIFEEKSAPVVEAMNLVR
ncbi:MAG: hypothetical protein WBQ34_18670 [Candidatus Acidiferrales bacterium]